MTRTEAAAFNAGVHAVFDLPRKTAAALNGASTTICGPELPLLRAKPSRRTLRHC